MEPLDWIVDYRVVDYDDVPSACKGLIELAGLKLRDPERMSLQHWTIAERYGLQGMVRIIS